MILITAKSTYIPAAMKITNPICDQSSDHGRSYAMMAPTFTRQANTKHTRMT